MEAKDYPQAPYPDLLVEGSPVGNCFQERLIKPGDSVAVASQQHPEWTRATLWGSIDTHNKQKQIQYTQTDIPSAGKAYIPSRLDWGRHVPVEKEEAVVAKKIDSWTLSMQEKFAPYVDKSMRTIQMLVSILVDSDALQNKPTQVPDQE